MLLHHAARQPIAEVAKQRGHFGELMHNSAGADQTARRGTGVRAAGECLDARNKRVLVAVRPLHDAVRGGHVQVARLRRRVGRERRRRCPRQPADGERDRTGAEIQVIAAGLGPATSILENGQARALAAVSSTRPVSRPDLPTLAEVGYPEFDLNSWMGVFVRSGTPPEIVTKLQDAILAALADQDISQRLTKLGLQPIPLRAAEFGSFVQISVGAWAKIVKATGSKSE